MRALVYANALAYTLGFVLTNAAFSLVNASFAETVKAGEPISSVALAAVWLREGTSYASYASLVPIVAGVALSSAGETAFHLGGFLCALGSNACFSVRALMTKKLRAATARSPADALDDVSLFHHVSRLGLGCVLAPMLACSRAERAEALALARGAAAGDAAALELVALLLFNGVCYATYNQSSYMVLSRVTLVSHTVLNALRRVVIICFTASFFGVKMTRMNSAGVALAVGGVLLFGWAQSRHSKAGARPGFEPGDRSLA